MGLQIIVGCDFDWPAARMVDDVHDLFLVGVEMDDAKWNHPTASAHNPIWPWACWFGGVQWPCDVEIAARREAKRAERERGATVSRGLYGSIRDGLGPS